MLFLDFNIIIIYFTGTTCQGNLDNRCSTRNAETAEDHARENGMVLRFFRCIVNGHDIFEYSRRNRHRTFPYFMRVDV